MTARRWVYDFDQALPSDQDDPRALLGGKGASLAEMTRAGLAVPHGFTITTACCARYFESGRTWPDGLADEVREHMARLERTAQRPFAQGDRPLLVAVHRGATVSMPGMMDTILNCGLGDDGRTPEADPWAALERSITAVFESWLSDRAVAYRRRDGITDLAGTAVNVQMMFPSEVSGVVFTVDPNAPDSQQMIIEASYGLGESVVLGDVTPDRYTATRDGAIAEREVGHKAHAVWPIGSTPRKDPDAPSLTDAQVGELVELALRVEEHFGHPVDIEFGWAAGRFAVLQSRRIRGLDVARDVPIARTEEVARLRSLSDGRSKCWGIHNLSETLRFPTPLTWDIVRSYMTGDGGYGRMYRQLGYRPSQRVCDEGFLELICGRIFADPQRQAELFWDAMPLAYDMEAVKADISLLDSAPTKFDPHKADGRFLAHLPANLLSMIRVSRAMKRLGKKAGELFENEALPPFLAYVANRRSQDLSSLSDEQLLAELLSRRTRVLDEFAPASMLPGFFGGMAFEAMSTKLVHLMGPSDGSELSAELVLALDGDTTSSRTPSWPTSPAEKRLWTTSSPSTAIGARARWSWPLPGGARIRATSSRWSTACERSPDVRPPRSTPKANADRPRYIAPCLICWGNREAVASARR